MGGSPGSTRNQLEPITAVCNLPTHIHNRESRAHRPPEWQNHISGQPQHGEYPPEDFLLHSSFYPSALPRLLSLDVCATQRLAGPALRHPQSRKSRATPTRSLLESCSEEAIQATPGACLSQTSAIYVRNANARRETSLRAERIQVFP